MLKCVHAQVDTAVRDMEAERFKMRQDAKTTRELEMRVRKRNTSTCVPFSLRLSRSCFSFSPSPASARLCSYLRFIPLFGQTHHVHLHPHTRMRMQVNELSGALALLTASSPGTNLYHGGSRMCRTVECAIFLPNGHHVQDSLHDMGLGCLVLLDVLEFH
jgi:hypothetical protein